MLKTLKESLLTLDLPSKLLLFFLLFMSGVNVYGIFEASSIGSYDRAMSHALYAGTLFLLEFVVLYASLYLSRGKKFYLEAKSLYGKDYEEKRMAMYEKLLESKEREIQ